MSNVVTAAPANLPPQVPGKSAPPSKVPPIAPKVLGGEISDLNTLTKPGSKGPSIIAKGFSFTGALLEGVFTVASGGTFGIISMIMYVLRIIAYLLYYIIVKIIPFLVMYIGIPTFILGVIMGLFFLGGHILFLVVFFAGLFLYLKNIYKVVYNLPKTISNNNNTMSSSSRSVKVKM